MKSRRVMIGVLCGLLLLLALISPLSSGARAPEGPTNLIAWDNGDYVQLSWDHDSTTAVNGYNIYRAKGSPVHWQKLNEKVFPLSAFVDYSAPRSELLYYRVNQIAANGEEILSASIIGVSTSAIAASAQLSALSTFDKNNIIIDAQLTNTNTMSAAQIQSFLASKGSVLANFSTGGKTAAQRIYDDCQTHRINPQVVLVTLQKEKGLITSGSANPNNLAMGWNTPDPTTADFANQIFFGTRQFRRYLDDLDFYGWTVGQPHSVSDGVVTATNTASAGLYIYTPWIGQGGGGQTGIGGNYLFWDLWYNSFGFDVQIANISQPEFKLPVPAGKDWLLSVETGTPTTQCPGGVGGRFYGGGFDCFHAGRSKYSLDILDNNLQEGELTGKANVDVLASASGTVTVGSDPAGFGNFVLIDHGNGFTSRYGHLSSISVSNGQSVASGSKLGVMGTTGNSTGIHVHFELRFNNEGAVASGTLDQVVVDGRTLISYKVGTVSSPTYFRSTNTSCSNAPATLRNRDGGPPIHPPGSLLKTSSSATVYLIDSDNRKRPITSASVLAQLYNQSTDARTGTNFSAWVITVGQDALDLYEQGGNISAAQPGNGKLFPDGKLIGLGSEVSIVTGNGKRRPFVSGSTFTGLGFNFCQVVNLTQTEYNSYPVGPPVEAMPILTSSVTMSPSGTVNVGQNISGSFTIKNVGFQSLPLSSLGIGGRLNGNPVDLNFVSTTLGPGSSFTYNSQPRQLNTPGTYTFFAAYQENNAHWAISVPAAPGVIRSRSVVVPACSYSINPQTQSFSASGGSGSVSVSAAAGCAWTAVSNSSFITITSGSSGSGNGTVNYSVAENTGPTQRSGTMTIAGKTFTVTQEALSCNYSIFPQSQSFSSSGGSGSVNVTAGNGCAWTAVTNSNFITVSSGNSGSGNGTVSYSVTENTSPDPRSGSITIAGQTFIVDQSGVSCSYSIQPQSQSFGDNGGSGSVNVTTASGCAWFAVSNDGFITITSGSSGAGNGTVNFSVANNTATTARTGTMTIAGQPFTVNQDASSTSSSINVALPSNGATASASSTLSSSYLPGNVINGERAGANSTTGGVFNGWISGSQTMPQWLQVDFGQTRSIQQIDVFMVQDNYQNPAAPTLDMTFTTFGLHGFEVQYWNGSSWLTVPSGSVSGNNKVWRQFTFPAISTNKIRVLTNASPDLYSRLTEVEAWTSPTLTLPPMLNVALPANGGVASASSTLSSNYLSGNVINGERAGANSTTGGVFNGWISGSQTMPQWLQVDFGQTRSIQQIDVFMVQDNYQNPAAPTQDMTFTTFGLHGFEVQYWNGSSWLTVPSGSVSGNNKVWRQFTFPAISTNKIRVLTNASPDLYSRLTEVEAWTSPTLTLPPMLNVALPANGGVASASSTLSSNYLSGNVINGERAGANSTTGGVFNGWISGSQTMPQWLQVDFGQTRSIQQIDVFMVQDNYQNPAAPTQDMTFTTFGLHGFEVQYWNGSSWLTVPSGSVSGNNKVWRQFTFPAISTNKIRVLTNASPDLYSRLTEIEAWTRLGPTRP